MPPCLAIVLCIFAGVEIDDLERRTVDYRRQIQRGAFVLSSELQVLQADGTWRQANRCEREIAFDGERHRSDTQWTLMGDDSLIDRPRTVLCRNCDPGRKFVSWMTNEQGNVNTCAQVQPVAETEGMVLYAPIDPRMAGMSPMGIANSVRYSLNSYLLDPGRFDLAIEPDQLQGRSCQRLAWRSPQGADVRLWIDEELGPSVVRLEEAAPAPGKALARTESEYQRDAATGIWFPSKITDTMFDGDRKIQVATTTIRIKSMNQRLDPRTFTMAGLGIPKGTCVLLEDQEGPFLWDGSKVVRTQAPPRRAREIARLDAEDVILSWRTILLLANGVVLAGLATFALWRFMRSG